MPERPRAIAWLAVFLFPLVSSVAGADPYPTDTCVAAKLRATADACKGLISAADLETRIVPARRVGVVSARLAEAWTAAEQAAAAAGASCEEATGSSGRVASLLVSRANALGSPLLDVDPVCKSEALLTVAQSCRHVLTAWSDHMADRMQDRDRAGLDAALAGADRKLDVRLRANAPSCDAGDRETLGAAVSWISGDALGVASTSQSVSREFTEIVPGDSVEYQGRTLEPRCSAGGPWTFWVRRGTVNKLLVYYQGGGACWNAVTCGGVPQVGLNPVFKQNIGPFDNPGLAGTGFADFSNPDNPFKDWHMVFIPYCTGDVHWGDNVVDYQLGTRVTHIEHKGYINAQVAEKWAREHFPLPEQVFVTGSSAGAYGAIVNSLSLQEFAYPSTEFAVLGDAGNGVITEDFLQNDLAIWGIEKNLPDWIPAFDVPLSELDAADLWAESAKFYTDNRFATYAAAYDGGFGGQTGFYNIMLNIDDPFSWPSWWNSSCQWNEAMQSLNAKAAAEAGNYRFYVGSGSAHTMWGRDKVYTDTTGNVATIRDWVDAMVEDTPAWQNVECTDCSTVLPGDPRPDPLEPPFTADDRIVCEE